MAKNDSRIKKSFENKQLGGYISIDITEETEDEEINSNIEFKYNMIYDNMGRLSNGEEIWLIKLEELKKYIDINKKRPTNIDKNKEIKSLGIWLSNQQTNYKEKTYIMKEQNIYDMWTQFITSDKYKIHFMNNTEMWLISFEEVKKYIDINNKRPSNIDKNKEIKSLGAWISTQQKNYKEKTQIMKEQNIYDMWTEFINSKDYSKYFN